MKELCINAILDTSRNSIDESIHIYYRRAYSHFMYKIGVGAMVAINRNVYYNWAYRTGCQMGDIVDNCVLPINVKALSEKLKYQNNQILINPHAPGSTLWRVL